MGGTGVMPGGVPYGVMPGGVIAGGVRGYGAAASGGAPGGTTPGGGVGGPDVSASSAATGSGQNLPGSATGNAAEPATTASMTCASVGREAGSLARQAATNCRSPGGTRLRSGSELTSR